MLGSRTIKPLALNSKRETECVSARLLEVRLRFGVPMTSPGAPEGILERLGLCFDPGTITLVTGPSGSGKSRLLAEIGRKYPTSRNVLEAPFPLDVSIVDAVLPTRPAAEAMSLLTACGLGEPALWVRRFDQLSEGERFRARLARTIGLQRREGSAAPLLCDEFCSVLHRRLAKVIAFNLRKLVSRERVSLVVATSQSDLQEDLAADRVVHLPHTDRGESRAIRKEGDKEHEQKKCRHVESGAIRRVSIADNLRIERGAVRDYATFAAMHYRQREQLGFVDKVFVMRDGDGGELLGVVVYGHPSLELALRNRVTQGRWIRQADKLNRELRVLKRLVIHPDLRGCGLGHWLVRQTLPMADVAFVECLAALGAVHPVFEKAGMKRVGTCRAPDGLNHAMKELRAVGADPFAPEFLSDVCRKPAVRRLVTACVSDWYRATTGGGESRVSRQTPSFLARTFRQLAGSEPVYFIWSRDAEGWKVIDRGLEQMGAAATSSSFR